MVEVQGDMAQPKTVPTDPTKAPTSAKASAVEAPFQISMLQESDRWLKMMVYSRHGGGKTELLGTSVDVPQMRDILFVSAESGHEVLYDSPRIENHDKIHLVKVQNFTQVARIQEFLKAYCVARDNNDVERMRKLYRIVNPDFDANAEPPRFRTVCLDSLTEIEAYAQYQILKIDQDTLMTDAGDMEVSGWPEFRKNLEMMKLTVRAYRNLPMHVLVAAAEGYSQDENKRYHYAPLMTGKLASQIQGFFDIVGWIVPGASSEVEPEAPRRVYVQPVAGGPRFDAKNRKPIFKQAYFENPNMLSIMRAIHFLKDPA